MRFSRQLNASSIAAPVNFQKKKTSELLDRGLVGHLLGGGLVSYSSIGERILSSIEGGLCAGLQEADFNEIRFPQIMRDSALLDGEELGDQFAKKMFSLGGPLGGHHLLTSPEMILPAIAATQETSSASFPMRLSYRTSIFRAMSKTKSFLTCREFRVVGAMTLMQHEQAPSALDKVLTEAADIVRDYAHSIGVRIDSVRTNGEVELAYECNEGDLKFISDGETSKHLSIGIGFEYAKDGIFPLSYRDSSNRLSFPRVMTMATCSNRLMFAAFDASRDEFGFNLSARIRPFDVVLVPRSSSDDTDALACRNALTSRGYSVGVDDRCRRSVRARLATSAYLGAPAAGVLHDGRIIWVGRGTEVDYGESHDLRASRWEHALGDLLRPGPSALALD